MADTISERIMQNVVTTLQGITTGAGYSITVAQVYRNTDPSLSVVTFPYIFVPEPQEDSEEVPLGFTTKFAHLVLWLWIRDTTATPNKVLNNLAGDVEKALLVDYTRGALAIDTTPKGSRISVDESAEPFQHMSMAFDIHYRHKYGDPFSLS